jgi:hypothetical protein
VSEHDVGDPLADRDEVINRDRLAVWRAMSYQPGSVTLSLRPKPMWSGAMHRYPAASIGGMIERYR